MIRSLLGMRAMLRATFIAATGGDTEAFGTADRLAAFAGLSPVPRGSGRVSGNMRRPHRYHRGLLRAFYLSEPPRFEWRLDFMKGSSHGTTFPLPA
ncbi:transposase [Streptomyces sp. NPDC006012]|uniref:transposase n=1 Tax=Streptomyces sp. NPDC006012 TaxID=3364739 RepID=UPI003679ECA9